MPTISWSRRRLRSSRLQGADEARSLRRAGDPRRHISLSPANLQQPAAVFIQGRAARIPRGPPGNFLAGRATGFAIHAKAPDGARSQNPRKYQDDAAVLERALATETDPFLISRYTFYLAQSYKDCGEREKALENYLKRAELGYWNEEIYVALLEAGNIMAALNRPFDEVIATYERAYQTVPSRAEALHAASHYCRMMGKNAEGNEFARRGIDLAQPASGLFLQPWVYEYGILDEFAINAYWAGAYRESLDASPEAAGERQTAAVDGEAHRRQRALRRRQAAEPRRRTSARSAPRV